MSDQSKQVVETKAEESSKPEFILLKSGVMMIGDALLGRKLAGIAAEAVNLTDDHGLAVLVFRNDGYPADETSPMFGCTFADAAAIAINLDLCWTSACASAEEGESNLSFLGMLWVNVLSAIGHELDHMDLATKNRKQYEDDRSTPEGNGLLEEVAAESAIRLIVNLAKKFDIEIPAVAELGWFGPKVMDLLTNDDTKDLEWVAKARTQMEHSVIYSEGKDKECFSFRDFVKKAHGNGKDKWDQPTTAINLYHHTDAGVVEEFKAEPVIEAVAETVELEQTEVEEIMAEGAEEIIAEAVADNSPDIVMVGGLDSDGSPTIVMTNVTDADRQSATEMVQQGTDGQFVGAGTEITEAEARDESPAMAALAAANPTLPAATVAEVPLPPAVAAQAAVVTQAATTAVPTAQPTPTTYTPNSLTPETMAAVIKSVWQTLYHHMFTKCGWQQNPQTGRFMFTNAAAVLEGVNIQHIITQFAADNFIMEYDTLSAEGQYAPEMCQGMIRGRTTSQAGLPSYSLYLNISGQRIKRTFMPQNPEKMNAQNAYTKSANEAAGGHMIVWVFKDEVADTAPFAQKCAVTIKNNVYEVMG